MHKFKRNWLNLVFVGGNLCWSDGQHRARLRRGGRRRGSPSGGRLRSRCAPGRVPPCGRGAAAARSRLDLDLLDSDEAGARGAFDLEVEADGFGDARPQLVEGAGLGVAAGERGTDARKTPSSSCSTTTLNACMASRENDDDIDPAAKGATITWGQGHVGTYPSSPDVPARRGARMCYHFLPVIRSYRPT